MGLSETQQPGAGQLEGTGAAPASDILSISLVWIGIRQGWIMIFMCELVLESGLLMELGFTDTAVGWLCRPVGMGLSLGQDGNCS